MKKIVFSLLLKRYGPNLIMIPNLRQAVMAKISGHFGHRVYEKRIGDHGDVIPCITYLQKVF